MPWALEEINSNGDYDAMAYDNDGYDFRAGLPRQLPLQQGLVAPRPVQAVRRQVRGRILFLPPLVPARPPSVSTSSQMSRGERDERERGRVALTPEPVPLCTIVQFRVVLIHVIRKIYYSALSLCIHRFQSTSVVHLGLSQGRQKTRKRKLLDVKQVSSGRGQYQKHLVAVERQKCQIQFIQRNLCGSRLEPSHQFRFRLLQNH